MFCTVQFNGVQQKGGKQFYLFTASNIRCLDVAAAVEFAVRGRMSVNTLPDDQVYCILKRMEEDARVLYEAGTPVVPVINYTRFPSIKAKLMVDEDPYAPDNDPESFRSVYHKKYAHLQELASRKEFPKGFAGMFFVGLNSDTGHTAIHDIVPA